MWMRQLNSPRRNHQSLPCTSCPATLPKLFLQPTSNPVFTGSSNSYSVKNAFHKSLQYGYGTPPQHHSPKLINSTDLNLFQSDYCSNYKFKNKSSKKNSDELTFDNEKPYTSSYIFFNYRHFLTSKEEREIKNYPEIFYLRRKPKKNNESLSNVQNSQQLETAQDSNIYNKIKTKINEEFNVAKNNEIDCDDDFQIGDHVAYRYEILEKLGSGAFGIVLKCFDHKTKQEVALKMIKETHENHPETVLEAKFLQHLQSGCQEHHIIEFHESFSFRNYYCISMEFVDLNKKSNSENSEEGNKTLFESEDLLQLFDAVHFMHSNGILHCDLKPSNIMFKINQTSQIKSPPFGQKGKKLNNVIRSAPSESPKPPKIKSSNVSNKARINQKKCLKIIDFGCSCFIGQCPYEKIQSLNYRSPEVVLRLMPYTFAIDIWSVGCIIFEVVFGKPLFNSNNEFELINEMRDLIGPPPQWMVKSSSRSAKFFPESSGDIKIKAYANTKHNPNKLSNNLIKSSSNEDDLIKSGKNSSKAITDSPAIRVDQNDPIRVCLPSAKNTTVRKNKIIKNSSAKLSLRERVSGGSPLLLSLLESCLTWDPHERITAEDLLRHPWANNIK